MSGISYVLEDSAELLTQFPIPLKGTWKSLPEHLLPNDVLYDSMNVVLHKGVLRSRAGLDIFSTFAFDSDVKGSFLLLREDGLKIPICATNTSFYIHNGTDWEDRTGSVSIAGNGSQVRFTSIEIGGIVYVIMVNNTVNMFYWTGSGDLQVITPQSGQTLPIAFDVITSAGRIVVAEYPFTIAWSEFINTSPLSFTNWPSSNTVKVSDTEDGLKAIRNLGTLGFAVYKEGSIISAFSQAGTSANAFRFEDPIEYEGPGGANALVKVIGGHIGFPPSGRIFYYNGSSYQFICDGLWAFLQDDIDTEQIDSIFGVHFYKTNQVYFWYPKINGGGGNTGMVIINLPLPLAGIQNFSYFLGETAFPVTNGLGLRLFQNNNTPLVFGYQKTYLLNFDCYTDNNADFTCSFQTGLYQTLKPGMKRMNSGIYKPIFELYSRRSLERGVVNIANAYSHMLETSTTMTSESEVIDLSESPPNQFIGFNTQGSFLGLQASWNSSAKFEYLGADIFGIETS